MNREHKFRAWDKNLQKMLSWDYLLKHNYFLNILTYDEDFYMVPMQFTSLLDKNGVEIYGGDIVLRNGRMLEVYWHEFTACWRMTGHTGITKSDMALMCEVIGNIYENPELLEK